MPGRCKPLSCVCGCRIPMRFVMALFCVLGVIISYGHRQGLTMAITRIVSVSVRNGSDDCPMVNATLAEEEIRGGQYEWSEEIQGFLISSFYVGYFIGQIPGGICADLIGPKTTYLCGMGASTAITTLTPVIIHYLPWYCVCLVRIVMGIMQGGTYPSMSVLIAHWVPYFERATLGAFSFASNALGAVLGNLLSGLVMSYTLYWPSTFYFWGGTGIVWCIGFALWVYDTPSHHPYLTEKERIFLENNMARYVRLKVPWKPILKDKSIWALIIGQVGHDYTLYLMMSNMPKYFSDVLHMTVKDISLVTSLPFIGMWLISIGCGKFIDYGIKNKNWNVKWCRRWATWVAFILPNTLLVLMVYVECHILAAALCFLFACLSKGSHFAGFKVNHMDITVNFNGIIMSLVNTSGCIGGFISPLIVSYVAPNNRLVEWKRVVWIIWCIAFVFTTYYLCTAQARRAYWDVPEDEIEGYKRDRADSALLVESKKFKKWRKKHEERVTPGSSS